MTSAWSHLPNAVHIDRILASAKAHPEVWEAAGYSARAAAWEAAWDAADDAARAAARYLAGVAVGDAAYEAVLTLVAWDNSAKFLDMTTDELEMWWVLSEDPACTLLLSAVRAFEQIEQLEFV